MLPLVPHVDLNASGGRVAADARFFTLSVAPACVRSGRDRVCRSARTGVRGALLGPFRHRLGVLWIGFWSDRD